MFTAADPRAQVTKEPRGTAQHTAHGTRYTVQQGARSTRYPGALGSASRAGSCARLSSRGSDCGVRGARPATAPVEHAKRGATREAGTWRVLGKLFVVAGWSKWSHEDRPNASRCRSHSTGRPTAGSRESDKARDAGPAPPIVTRRPDGLTGLESPEMLAVKIPSEGSHDKARSALLSLGCGGAHGLEAPADPRDSLPRAPRSPRGFPPPRMKQETRPGGIGRHRPWCSPA